MENLLVNIVSRRHIVNGFGNYMRRYVDQNYGCDLYQAVVMGSKAWNRLVPSEQRKFKTVQSDSDQLVDSCCPTKRKRRSRRKRGSCPPKACKPKRRGCKPACPTRKRKPACRPKPSCPVERKRRSSCKPKCSAGPVTNNAFFNFLRYYRRKHCTRNQRKLVSNAARVWCRLSERKKQRYRRQACEVMKSSGHKRRKICKT